MTSPTPADHVTGNRTFTGPPVRVLPHVPFGSGPTQAATLGGYLCGVSATSWTVTNLTITNGAALYVAGSGPWIVGRASVPPLSYTATAIVIPGSNAQPDAGNHDTGHIGHVHLWSAGVGVSTTYLWIWNRGLAPTTW